MKVCEESENCNILLYCKCRQSLERGNFFENGSSILCSGMSRIHGILLVEGTSGDHLIQPTKQGQVKQLVQDCVQLGFEYL